MSQMKAPLTASSKTDCKEQPLLFQDLGSRQVVADFSGGTLSSDGGALFQRQVDNNFGLTPCGHLAIPGEPRRRLLREASFSGLSCSSSRKKAAWMTSFSWTRAAPAR